MARRGGARPGAGRPAIDPAESKTRPQRQVRAFDDEWEVVQMFSDLIKRGCMKLGKDAILDMKEKINRVRTMYLRLNAWVSKASNEPAKYEKRERVLKRFLNAHPEIQIKLDSGPSIYK